MPAMRRQVEYLQRNDATGVTPISSIKKVNKWQQICGDEITTAIRAVVRAASQAIGFTEAVISALSLCRGSHGFTHDTGGPKHHPPGGEVAEQHDAPLPSHDRKELHGRSFFLNV